MVLWKFTGSPTLVVHKLAVVVTLSVIFLTGESSPCLAQQNWGIKAGYCYSYAINRVNYYNAFYLNFIQSPVSGIAAGAFFEQRLRNDFLYRIELDYATTGYSTRYEIDTYRYNYIMLPLAIKYQPKKQVGVLAGPYTSFLPHLERKSFRQKWDLGIHFGTDITIYKNWGVGIQYFMGIVDLHRSLRSDIKDYSRSIQFTGWYRFTTSERKTKKSN